MDGIYQPGKRASAHPQLHFGLPSDQSVRLGRAVREHWSVENKNHPKRDHHVWQEDDHRHRRVNIAQNLAQTRNGLLAIIPFDEKHTCRQ